MRLNSSLVTADKQVLLAFKAKRPPVRQQHSALPVSMGWLWSWEAVPVGVMSCPEPVAIALGSNLGDPLSTLPWAVSALQSMAEGGALRCSPWFRSGAVGGPPNQPDYINGVVLMHCSGSPMALLQRLQALEQQAGRRPGPRWGPRVLDLDLLWFGQRRSATAELLLPHPRWQQRSFVLAPLAALDPHLVAPHASCSCEELLRNAAPPYPQLL